MGSFSSKTKQPEIHDEWLLRRIQDLLLETHSTLDPISLERRVVGTLARPVPDDALQNELCDALGSSEASFRVIPQILRNRQDILQRERVRAEKRREAPVLGAGQTPLYSVTEYQGRVLNNGIVGQPVALPPNVPMTTAALYKVTVPRDCYAGSAFEADVGGARMRVIVPPNAGPGMEIVITPQQPRVLPQPVLVVGGGSGQMVQMIQPHMHGAYVAYGSSPGMVLQTTAPSYPVVRPVVYELPAR